MPSGSITSRPASQPGHRKTVADVARAAGVAASTVSGVLRNRPWCYVSDKTRQQVLDAARRIGYSPNMLARSLRGEKTHTVGVMFPLFSQNLVTDAKLQSVENAAWRQGYRLLVGTHQGDERRHEKLLDEFLSRRVDAVIFWSSMPDDGQLIERARAAGVAIVSVESSIDLGVPSVCVDREHGGYLLGRHVIDIGRRRPAFLLSSHRAEAGQAKIRGLRRALAESKLDMADFPVIESAETGGNPSRLGMKLTRTLLERGEDFDAIVTLSDNVAQGAMAALYQANRRIPHEVAVLGFDDQFAPESMLIPLTSVRQPRDIGDDVFRLLLAQLDRADASTGGQPTDQPGSGRAADRPQRLNLQPTLIVRESTVAGAGVGD